MPVGAAAVVLGNLLPERPVVERQGHRFCKGTYQECEIVWDVRFHNLQLFPIHSFKGDGQLVFRPGASPHDNFCRHEQETSSRRTTADTTTEQAEQVLRYKYRTGRLESESPEHGSHISRLTL